MPPRTAWSSPPELYQSAAVRSNSCVRLSVWSTAARTRRTSAPNPDFSPAASAAARCVDDCPTAGDPKPVLSGACAVGAGFAFSAICGAVNFCRSGWPPDAFCSSAVAGARRSFMPQAHATPIPATNARPEALIKACFIGGAIVLRRRYGFRTSGAKVPSYQQQTTRPPYGSNPKSFFLNNNNSQGQLIARASLKTRIRRRSTNSQLLNANPEIPQFHAGVFGAPSSAPGLFARPGFDARP